MYRLIRKTSLYVGCFSAKCLGHSSNVSSLRIRWLSISSTNNEKHSFTVSYLINSLGFDQNKALLASKYVNLQTSEKPDKTIEFFEGQGLTRSQIASLVKIYPKVLLSNTKSILLKLEFLISKGITRPEIATILSSYPAFIKTSLTDQIKPSYDFLRDFFGSDEKAISVVKRSPDILVYSLKKCVSPNIYTLRLHEVPDSIILKIAMSRNRPRLIAQCPDKFKIAVEKVSKMGFDASSEAFIHALTAMCLGTRNPGWVNRVDVYKKWGWTAEEVLLAFKADPRCMLVSPSKIEVAMEFFVDEIGLKPSQLAKSPFVFSYHLKNAKLRYSVSRLLVSKGLLKEGVCIFTSILLSENDFAKKFVTPYVKEAPELLELYDGNSIGTSLSSTSESGEEQDQ